LDPAAFAKLSDLLGYVAGDYRAPATWAALRAALGKASRPLHYLAIPPSLFPTVVEGLGASRCAVGARVVVEKPFGRDLASARALLRGSGSDPRRRPEPYAAGRRLPRHGTARWRRQRSGSQRTGEGFPVDSAVDVRAGGARPVPRLPQ